MARIIFEIFFSRFNKKSKIKAKLFDKAIRRFALPSLLFDVTRLRGLKKERQRNIFRLPTIIVTKNNKAIDRLFTMKELRKTIRKVIKKRKFPRFGKEAFPL